MTTYIKEKVEKIEKPIALWVCLSMIAVLALAYIYFVNGFVTNTLDIRQSVLDSASLASRIADKEFKYTQISQNIDADFFVEQGFVLAREGDINYVTVKAGPVVTFSGGI